jgi:hypothetical protein
MFLRATLVVGAILACVASCCIGCLSWAVQFFNSKFHDFC